MKKFDSLKNIRKEIDEIDLQILDLISQRKNLVTEVVKLKRRDQIIDQKRINDILKRLDKEARQRDLPKSFVKEIWNIMIKSFIEYEEEIFDKIHSKKS